MFARLARNIAISGVAFGVIGVIGLALAPILIAAYGFAGYGQILLARMVLPSGTLGVLEFGTSETATRIVATAREDQNWRHASGTLGFLGALVLVVIVPVALALAIFASDLTQLLSIPKEQAEGFSQILVITSFLLPFLFFSLIFEGVLKGFEDFKRQRSCEVSSSIIFAILAVVLVIYDFGANWIAGALLVGLSVRFVMAAYFALNALRKVNAPVSAWTKNQRNLVLEWSQIMLVNKLIGSVQGQSVLPLLGFIFGPVAVGAFDAVARLPRFVKSVFGLLNVVLLPMATGLYARNDSLGVQRLGQIGILTVMMLTWPTLGVMMAGSAPILEIWLGNQVAANWGWQALLFIVPMLTVVWSFGANIILAQRRGAMQSNRIVAIQVVIQLALSFLMLRWLNEWAFALGLAASSVLLFPLQMRLLAKWLGFDRRFYGAMARQAMIIGIMCVPTLLIATNNSRPELAIAVAVLTLPFIWLASYFGVLSPEQREAFSDMVRRRWSMLGSTGVS